MLQTVLLLLITLLIDHLSKSFLLNLSGVRRSTRLRRGSKYRIWDLEIRIWDL